MKFSERMGITPQKAIQLESMDDDLKNSLWNAFYKISILPLKADYLKWTNIRFSPELQNLWTEHFKLPIDSIPENPEKFIQVIKVNFFRLKWNEIYDFIEFVQHNHIATETQTNFADKCNSVLEREKSGYRFVGGQIIPIVDEQEMAEIEKAIANSHKLNQTAVREHLQNALAKLADRKKPDYRNSIKESVSALESLARAIINNPKVTLSDALKLIDQKIQIHPALKDAYIKIYGYTSDSSGIRHSMTEEGSKCELEDAQYMLISCSAFINYLFIKAEKAGIKL